MTGVPEGECVVLDVTQLEALLVKTFHIGLNVGRGKDQGALVRLRLSKALVGAVEAQALAAESNAREPPPGWIGSGVDAFGWRG